VSARAVKAAPSLLDVADDVDQVRCRLAVVTLAVCALAGLEPSREQTNGIENLLMDAERRLYDISHRLAPGND
jgi:hypothetical protein